MRKGFSLIELVVIIMILPIAMLVISKLYYTFLLEIPQSYKMIQENTTLLNLLEKFQQDIDLAKRLPGSFAGNETGDKLLLIEQSDGVICYKIEDGRVLRYQLTETNEADQSEEYWSLPKANIQWRIWEENRENHAVEIKTYIEYNVHGHFEKRLANSHLYYVGAL